MLRTDAGGAILFTLGEAAPQPLGARALAPRYWHGR
jgi:hypothetical protein